MNEKDQHPSPTLSFEKILGWFGKLTPQFKLRLMALSRVTGPAEYDNFAREIFSLFHFTMVTLARVPKGPARARAVYNMIDEEYRVAPPTGVSCSSGCAACCHFPKQITDDEADLLLELVSSGSVAIDREALRAQARAAQNQSKESSVSHPEPSACVFLGDDNRCRIYADRPSVCRKYHALTPAENCASSDPAAKVSPRIDLMPELIVSATMSMPDNGIGFMAVQLERRLERVI